MSSKNKCLKDNLKYGHWFGHQQLGYLNTYDSIKVTPVGDKKQASEPGNTMKQSVSRGGNNQDL